MPEATKSDRAPNSARHEASRMIAFSDGVVAIAITLLILPLAAIDLPLDDPAARANPLIWVYQHNEALILGFVISWFVILVFWLAHHRIFGGIAKINNEIIRWNALWLFAVVVLPFPTNLVSQTDRYDAASRPIVAFYIFTMLFMSAMLALIGLETRRNPDLLTAEARAGQDLKNPTGRRRGLLYLGYLFLLFIVALLAPPSVALYGLIGLALLDPLNRYIESRQAALSGAQLPPAPPATS